MAERTGIGLVGLGRWGRNYYRTIVGLPACRLVAVADTDADALTQAVGVPIRVRTVHELLELPAVQSVIVATPSETHYQIAAAALAAGRDVLVEKPLALDLVEAQRLVSLARERGLVLAVGFTMLYHPEFARLQAACAAGALGRIRRLVMARSSTGQVSGKTDVIADLVVHDLAMAIRLKSEPRAVQAKLRPRAVSYQLQFDDGATATGWAAWQTAPVVRRLRVVGSRGTVVFVDGDGGRGDRTEDELISKQPLARQVLDFCRCCLRRTRPVSDGELGLAVSRWLVALTYSAANRGAWVEAERTAVRNQGSVT